MDDLENKLTSEDKNDEEKQPEKGDLKARINEYWKGCIDPENARLYGTFQQRMALNITQFPKIMASMIWRMGYVYGSLLAISGLSDNFKLMHIDPEQFAFGYLAYFVEIQLGLGKYTIEGVGKGIKYLKKYISNYKNASPS